jgi:hypothetical protein
MQEKFWIVLSIGLPRTVRRLLVILADLLIEIVQDRHLRPFTENATSIVHRKSVPGFGI